MLVGIAVAFTLVEATPRGNKMWSPLTSICGTAMALIPGLLWNLSARGFRMANSCEELLDLFEERYGMHGMPQERDAREESTGLEDGDAVGRVGKLRSSDRRVGH
jgi:hypothetical protein